MNTLTVHLHDGERVLLNLETTTTAQPHDVLNAFMALLDTPNRAGIPSKARPVGKYAPLADHLEALDQPSIQLTFTQIEHLLGVALPDSAHEHRAWWANDVTHSQARAWTSIGWQSSDVGLNTKTVKFIRASLPQAAEPTSKKQPTLVIGGVRLPLVRDRRSK